MKMPTVLAYASGQLLPNDRQTGLSSGPKQHLVTEDAPAFANHCEGHRNKTAFRFFNLKSATAITTFILFGRT